ncbi:MAG: hypothetical protein ACRDXX_18045 [Stackebrandtia sp.]
MKTTANPSTYNAVMLVATLAVGAAVATMGVLSVPGVGAVAVVGGFVVAAGWAIRGLVVKRDDSDASQPVRRDS